MALFDPRGLEGIGRDPEWLAASLRLSAAFPPGGGYFYSERRSF